MPGVNASGPRRDGVALGAVRDDRADPADPATWRGDHYDMTPRRRLFEAWHKTAGWSLIALAVSPRRK